jgi:hypothetical protein
MEKKRELQLVEPSNRRLGFEYISSIDAIPFLDERSLKGSGNVPGRIKAKLKAKTSNVLAQIVPSRLRNQVVSRVQPP